jgi:pimeloyl-ACP methyl ester carboxylesterase
MVMAPAIGMRAQWAERYGEKKLEGWKAAGAAPTFHHAYGEERLIGYGLYEDLAKYDPAPPARVPTLAFMGRRDETVSPAAVESWASQNPNVRLNWLDSGHELTDQLETMWNETAGFFGLA